MSLGGVIKIAAGALGAIIGGKTLKSAAYEIGGHLVYKGFVSELSVYAESGSSKIDDDLLDVFVYRHDIKGKFTTLLDVRRIIINYSDGIKIDPDDLNRLYKRVRKDFLNRINECGDDRYQADVVEADEKYELELISKLKKLMMRDAGYRVVVENVFTPEMEGYVNMLKQKYKYSKDELYRLMLQFAREQNYKLDHDISYTAEI